jgi:hypothetical protein
MKIRAVYSSETTSISTKLYGVRRGKYTVLTVAAQRGNNVDINDSTIVLNPELNKRQFTK